MHGWRVVAMLLVGAGVAAAQGAPTRPLAARAFDLERSGNYAGAVAAYRAILADDPGLASALLGLERSLGALSRVAEMTAEVVAALARAEPAAAAYPVAIRVWSAAGQPDSARAAAERWARLDPTDEAPWREWGLAASGRRDLALAREAFTTGRARLGRADALAVELAQLASLEENYPAAVAEWVQVLRRTPRQQSAAVALLGQAAPARRGEVLRLLAATGLVATRRVAAVLTARWGDPLAGFDALAANLPAERAEQMAALHDFRDEISGLGSSAARIAEGRALDRLATLASGEEAIRYLLDAAQAYSDGGAADAARQTLARIASARGVPNEVTSRAAVTLVGVLVDEGRIVEADRQLAALEVTLTMDDAERLRRRVAVGYLRAGELERAAALVAADSSVDGLDLAGRIRVYQGDLLGGGALLRAAGPFAGSREEASGRLHLLALLQVMGGDSLPDLGRALFALERGDSLAAARELARLGGRTPAAHGGAELLLLAGRLLAGTGQDAEAERALTGAAGSGVAAAGAAAGLELARLEARTGRRDAARTRLEGLILGWPASAVAPEARRLLDQLRGSTPGGEGS